MGLGHMTKYPKVGRQEIDSLGSYKWQLYTNSQRLQAAWSTPIGSPYSRYQRYKTISSMDQLQGQVNPRYSYEDRVSVEEIKKIIHNSKFDEHTAVILDSGGQHSIAMGAELVVQMKYQPVVMIDSPIGNTGEYLAAFLYNAARVDQARVILQPTSPPVFIMDAHRSSITRLINQEYSYGLGDLPTAKELKASGITRVIYLNEADYEGKVVRGYTDILPRDIRQTIDAWRFNGVCFLRTGISPNKLPKITIYPDSTPITYGGGKGIRMNINHHQYLLREDGKLSVGMETGLSRGMSDDEIFSFKSQIEIQLAKQPSNEELKRSFLKFPSIYEKIC
jgi:hypothetical protein